MTPEQNARALWEERHGSLAVERDRWRWAAFVAFAFAAVALAVAVWAAVTSRYQPYIVPIDRFGEPRAVIAPETITDWPDPVVRHQLGAFIRDWRAVSVDGAVMRARLQRINFFLEIGSPARVKIVTWTQDNDPFQRAETETVDISVESVNLVGGQSWLAEWTETPRRRGTGRVGTIARFQGTFTLIQRRVRDDSLLLQNPLGMVVEDFDIVRVE